MRIRSTITKNSTWKVIDEEKIFCYLQTQRTSPNLEVLADRVSSSPCFRQQRKIQLICWWFPHASIWPEIPAVNSQLPIRSGCCILWLCYFLLAGAEALHRLVDLYKTRQMLFQEEFSKVCYICYPSFKSKY